MTRCHQTLAVSLLVTTALFVVPLRADDDHIRYTIAFRAENPWPVGVLGMIDPDGSRQKFLDFKRPKQKSWQWGAHLPDGRVILTSLEAADVAEIRAGKVVTHSWLYSPASGKLTKLLGRDPLSKNIYVQNVLPGGRRLLALVFLPWHRLHSDCTLAGFRRFSSFFPNYLTASLGRWVTGSISSALVGIGPLQPPSTCVPGVPPRSSCPGVTAT